MPNVFTLFIITILVEIFLLVTIGEIIGGFETVLVVVLTAIFGIYILRNPNLMSIQMIMERTRRESFIADFSQKPVISPEPIVESVLVLTSGFLLIMPGFLTDFIGLIAYFPISRLFLVKRLSKYFVLPLVAANDQFIKAKYHHDDD